MKKFIVFSLFILIFSMSTKAQLMEQFSDSNFTQNPEWKGVDSSFYVNGNLQLQSNAQQPNAVFYISTANSLATSVQWQFYIQLAFNTSSLNYVDIYLLSSDSNLLNTSNTGYFLRLGGTNDDICLYRKDNDATVKLTDGEDGLLNSANNSFTLTITRNSTNTFIITRTDEAGHTTLSGMVTDENYQTTAYFGFLIKQSTSSFFSKHFFDNILIQPMVDDTIPPKIDTLIINDEHALTLYFDEPVAFQSLLQRDNFVINNGIGFPDSFLVDSLNPDFIKLRFNHSLPARTSLTLSVSNVSDLSGNNILPVVKDFVCYKPMYNDILIDEVMPDPFPSQGLPEKEWIEIRNISPFPIDLSGWYLKKNEEQTGPIGKYLLKKDSCVVLCSSASSAAMMLFATSLAVSNFPSLNNLADTISLLSPDNQHIHSIAYTSDSHENEVKKMGGWSLEMIDVTKPCIGQENWSSSINAIGGSPGKINSINGPVFSENTLELERAFANDSLTITLQFKSPLDSVSGAIISNFYIDNYYGNILQANPLPPLFDKVQLLLDAPLQRGNIYTIKAESVLDCIGNTIGSNNMVRFGLAEISSVQDIVVNEILFNPTADGYDYVELFNRSKKAVELNSLLIANRNILNEPDNISPILENNYLFLPGDYIVLTENPKALMQHYFVAKPGNVIPLQNMPSFNDDEGNVLLMNKSGSIIDEVHYKDDWHFSLLTNVEGVALERINPDAPTDVKENWHSASSSNGYGTPTYKNAQSSNSVTSETYFAIDHQVISPNNDGADDVLGIFYSFPDNGNVATVKVFDAMGRLVANPVKNLLCGTKGSFFWHGLDDNNHPLLPGIYVVYFEAYGANGKIRKGKKSIAVK